tara:strand:- start:2965 stop:4932 length:1968 start_codon:yes stop_codon:yes gene_type:complete
MDIDTMVESHFKKKRDVFGFEGIAQLIEEVMDSMSAAGIPLGESKQGTSLLTEVKGFSAASFFDSIWTPNITEEIGEVKDSNETRQSFIRSMNGIGGKGLRDKIARVTAFMKQPDPNLDVAEVLAFITFLKCMSEVFTKYSPSGSGFLLEAFLAGLMKGRQVVEVTDEEGNVGGLPLTDYKTGAGDPVSLKRLTGGSGKTPIKGSLNNLAGHLAKNPERGIDYVIAAIYGEAQQVSFFEFNINMDNVIEWVGKYITPPPGWEIPAPGDMAPKLKRGEAGYERKGKYVPGPGEREDEAIAATRFRTAVMGNEKHAGIQLAIGVPPGALMDREMTDGEKAPSIKKGLDQALVAGPSAIKASAEWLGQQTTFLTAMAKHGGKVPIQISSATKKGRPDPGPDATPKQRRDYEKNPIQYRSPSAPEWTGLEIINPEEVSTGGAPQRAGQLKITPDLIAKALAALQDDKMTKEDYIASASILNSAFKSAISQTSRISNLFSTGGFSYKDTKAPGAETKSGQKLAKSLAGFDEEQQAAFAAWAKTDPKGFTDLVRASAGSEGEKSQFLIEQDKVTSKSEYFMGEIVLERKTMLNVVTKYNSTIKERLMPVFIGVDNLMGHLQLLYTTNDLTAGERAGQDCVELKSDLDDEMTTRRPKKDAAE